MEKVKNALIKKAIIISGIAFLLGFSLFGAFGGGSSIISAQTSSTSALDVENIKSGDYNVLAEEGSSLPVLTKEQVKEACESLPGKQKENALKFLDYIMEIQDKYKINAIFTLAVFRCESGIASSDARLIEWGTYNLASVSGKYNNQYVTLTHSDGSTQDFRKYPDYKTAIDDFGNLIANSDNYFKGGKYTVDEIGISYCGKDWCTTVKGYMDELYAAVGVQTTEIAENTEDLQSNDTGNSSNTQSSSKGDGYTTVAKLNEKNYKEFKQNSSNASYKSIVYSNERTSIAGSGCGPTSIAIIASGYGLNYTPGTLVNAAKKKYNTDGFYCCIESTYKMLLTAGLKGTIKTNITKDELVKHLKSGKPAAVSTHNNDGKGIFAVDKHYIAVLGINEKNEVYVSNPNYEKKSGWFDIDTLMKYIHAGAILVTS